MARGTRIIQNATSGTIEGNSGATGNDDSELNAASGETAANEYLDPADLASPVNGSQGSNGSGNGSSAGEPVRKRRGRKPGSINAKKGETISVDGLASIIFSAHAMLAGITHSQELMLDPTEATQLAQATANVSRHYGVAMAAKTVDWINFAMVAGGIYGTRLIAIRMRRQYERAGNHAKPVNTAPQQQEKPVNNHVDPLSPRAAPDQPQPDFAEFSRVYSDDLN